MPEQMFIERPEQPRRRQALDFVDQPKPPMFEAARHANPTGKEVGPTPEDKRYYEDLCLLLKIEPPDLDENQRREWQRQSDNGKRRARAAQRLEAQGFKDARNYINADNIPDFKDLDLVRNLATAEMVVLTGDQMDNLYNDGIKFDIVASVNSFKRELDEAHNAQIETVEKTNVVEPEKVFYPRVLDDLEMATHPFQRIKGLTDTNALRLAKLHNARIQEAIDNLDAAGVDTTGFVGKGDEAKRNKNRLTMAVTTLQLVREGRAFAPEEIQRSIDFLASIGIDTVQIELPISVQSTEEASAELADKRTSYEKELDNRLRMAGGDPGAVKKVVGDWMSRHANEADRIPDEVRQKARDLLAAAEVEVQRQKALRGAQVSAFGMTPEQLAQLGVEERAQRKDPIIVELERPIRGHKIPFEYGGMAFTGGVRAERRAIEDGESFSGERVKLLLAPLLTESLQIYNGEVTGETKADFSTLSSVESILRTRIGEIQKTLADARKGEKADEAHKLYFASLIPAEQDLGLGDITEQTLKAGFGSLTEAQLARIPEIRALKEMKQILTWHEAEQQLLRALQAMRSYSAGKKIDSISALGEQADRPLLPTSAILRIWGLEQLENVPDGEKHEEERMVAKYSEDAMRIYSLIADVAKEMPLFSPSGEPSFKADNQTERGLKRLIWEHLLVPDLVTEGTVPVDQKFVLNRFGQGLNSERLATVEAFVEHLVTTGALDKLAGSSDDSLDDLVAQFDAGLTETIKKAIEKAKEEMAGVVRVENVPEAELSAREKEIQLGCANAVAMIHVTGLADKLAVYYLWVAKDDEKVREARDKEGKVIWLDKKILTDEKQRVPMVKVGGYPACTAASELMNWTAKLRADLDIYLPIGPATLEDALKKDILPPSLARTFLEYTTLNEEGRVASLWDYWAERGLPIYKLTKLMAEKLGPNVHGAWLTSLKSSNNLRTLMTATGQEPYQDMYKNDKLLGDISSALYFGLGPTHTGSKEPIDSVIKGVIYAGLLVYNSGISGQITSMEATQRLAKIRATAGINDEIKFFLRKLIDDGLASKGGALNTEGLKVVKELIEQPYFVKRFGRRVTQGTLGSTAFLVNQISGGPGRAAVPYADIWEKGFPKPEQV